jgi:hypothetical protein
MEGGKRPREASRSPSLDSLEGGSGPRGAARARLDIDAPSRRVYNKRGS